MKKFIWEQLKSKKGFFMPTIIIYLLFFFSFLIIQVIQVMDYKIILKNQIQNLEMYAIKNKIINYVKNDMQYQEKNLCIIPTTYDTINVGNLKIHVKNNCLRKPKEGVSIIPENYRFKILYDTIVRNNGQVNNETMNSVLTNLTILASMQINNEWIGIPIDIETIDPIEWPIFAEIQSLDFIYCYTFSINTSKKNHKFFIVSNISKKNIVNIMISN